MKRGSLPWFFKAVSDRLGVMLEKPVRDVGAFVFRHGVNAARAVGLLPKPQPGNGILVINLTSHFGDGIMLLPMLQALHEAHPGVPIDLACTRGVDGLFAAVPFLRTVYAAPLPPYPPLTLKKAMERRLAIVRWYREALQGLHPETCVMPRWGDDLFGSLYLAYLIGSPQRVAFDSTVDRYQRSAPQRDRMLTGKVRGGQAMHEPLRFLHLMQGSGLIPADLTFRTDIVSPTLQRMAAAVDWEALRQRLGLPTDLPLAVLAPGASSPNKTWPSENWVIVSRRLLEQGFRVVLLSGRADKVYAEGIAATLNNALVHTVAGSTSLVESIALLSHAVLFLGNDSGPGHAAGALGVPTVTLFISDESVYPDHPYSAARIGPMGPYTRGLHPHLLDICVNACLLPKTHCIATITAESATKALLALQAQKLQDDAHAN